MNIEPIIVITDKTDTFLIFFQKYNLNNFLGLVIYNLIGKYHLK